MPLPTARQFLCHHLFILDCRHHHDFHISPHMPHTIENRRIDLPDDVGFWYTTDASFHVVRCGVFETAQSFAAWPTEQFHNISSSARTDARDMREFKRAFRRRLKNGPRFVRRLYT
jgi:hypothetical protein